LGPPPTPSSLDPLLTAWLQAAAAAHCLHGVVGRQPAAVATTVASFLAAASLLPAAVTRVAHPIVVAAAVTGAALTVQAAAHGDASSDAAFAAYMNGVRGCG
jgi:hypothetical protein